MVVNDRKRGCIWLPCSFVWFMYIWLVLLSIVVKIVMSIVDLVSNFDIYIGKVNEYFIYIYNLFISNPLLNTLEIIGLILLVFILVKVFKLFHNYLRKLHKDLLEFWCKELISKQLITLYLDPYLFQNIKSEVKQPSVIGSIFNLNTTPVKANKQNYKFIDYFQKETHFFNQLGFLLKQNPELIINPYFFRDKKRKLLLLWDLLIAFLMIFLSIVFSLLNFSSASIIFGVISFITFFIGFLIVFLAYLPIYTSNLIINIIFNFVFLYDPEADTEQHNDITHYLKIPLKVSEVIEIIQSYLNNEGNDKKHTCYGSEK